MIEQQRRYKVRGQEIVGTEVGRSDERITLMCTEPAWPFPSLRAFDRKDLIRLDGGNNDDEPKVAKKRRARRVAA